GALAIASGRHLVPGLLLRPHPRHLQCSFPTRRDAVDHAPGMVCCRARDQCLRPPTQEPPMIRSSCTALLMSVGLAGFGACAFSSPKLPKDPPPLAGMNEPP